MPQLRLHVCHLRLGQFNDLVGGIMGVARSSAHYAGVARDVPGPSEEAGH